MGHVRPGRRAKEERRLRAQEREGVKIEPPVVVTTIAEARSFEELFQVISRGPGLQGSAKFYSPVDLINLIRRVKGGGLPVTYITHTGGLQDKVRQLLRSRTVGELKKVSDLRHTIAKEQRAATGLREYFMGY